MLVPSKTANGACANSGSVEDRISPPGAVTSGLRRCVKSVGPAEEKLIMIPPRAVCSSRCSNEKRTAARPPIDARKSRNRAPSRSPTIPPGTGSGTPIRPGSPARLSTRTMPTAPAAWARSPFVTIAQ